MEALTLGMSSIPLGELHHAVHEAKRCAEILGPYSPEGARAGLEEARHIVQRHKSKFGIQVERDPFTQDAIASHLLHVLGEALLLHYNITDDELQQKLMNVAVLMHTGVYVPPPVLGATAEAFRRR